MLSFGIAGSLTPKGLRFEFYDSQVMHSSQVRVRPSSDPIESPNLLGMPLAGLLKKYNVEPRLRVVVNAIADACAEISTVLRGSSGVETVGSQNAFGDVQLVADVRTHNLVVQHLAACGAVATCSSEEEPIETALPHDEGQSYFSVAFDPLDGSSIIGSNFAVGSIFGVWPDGKLVGTSGRRLSSAACAVYGPRTTFYLALSAVAGAVEFTLHAQSPGQWAVTRHITSVNPGKLFAPANMRSARDLPGYAKLLDFYMSSGYQLRYTGGMVPGSFSCRFFPLRQILPVLGLRSVVPNISD